MGALLFSADVVALLQFAHPIGTLRDALVPLLVGGGKGMPTFPVGRHSPSCQTFAEIIAGQREVVEGAGHGSFPLRNEGNK